MLAYGVREGYPKVPRWKLWLARRGWVRLRAIQGNGEVWCPGCGFHFVIRCPNTERLDCPVCRVGLWP